MLLRVAPYGLIALLLGGCSEGAELGPGALIDGGLASDAAAPGLDAATPEDGDAEVATLGDAGFGEDAEPGLEDAGSTHPPVLLPAGGPVDTDLFSTAEACVNCHSNSPGAAAMRDLSSREIAPYDLWQSSMMANATRDPFFRAVLSAEIAATPAATTAIEAKCFSCHGPMAKREAAAAGQHFGLADLYAGGVLGDLALDGVSCALCHQITPEGLGEPQSFTAGFLLSETRQMFGPHGNVFGMPMVRHTGFTPTRGDQIMDSALCGSCHTLHTDALDAEGVAVGARLPEQTPYLEWRNSAFSTESASPTSDARSCQSCHTPLVDEEGRRVVTAIARNPGGGDFGIAAREPYGRHVLVGGNTLVPAMLRDNAAELRPKAPAAAFDATIARARDQLENRTARLTVLRVEPAGDRLAVVLSVENLTGHKLPTAYPSRRVWLRVRVEDPAGATVYEVGGFDARGRLVDAAGQVLPSERAGGPTLPHVDRIEGPEAPLVYQSVMGDVAGAATFTLLRGAAYVKDNRLLPLGWRSDGPDADQTAPVGVQDAGFVGGVDEVTVLLPASATGTVQADLLYQVISPRWVDELSSVDTPEVASFLRYWAAADVRPEVLARTQASLP